MRFHKAVEISRQEAEFIIEGGSATTAQSDFVVIARGERYYDVRTMTHSEIEAFVADLARAEYAAEAARRALPC